MFYIIICVHREVTITYNQNILYSYTNFCFWIECVYYNGKCMEWCFGHYDSGSYMTTFPCNTDVTQVSLLHTLSCQCHTQIKHGWPLCIYPWLRAHHWRMLNMEVTSESYCPFKILFFYFWQCYNPMWSNHGFILHGRPSDISIWFLYCCSSCSQDNGNAGKQ